MNIYLSMTTFKIRNKNKQKFKMDKNIQYERRLNTKHNKITFNVNKYEKKYGTIRNNTT